ncbi:S26 family signal peptidase [Halovenus sp. HT40]|uniref:S26 family signal peptidase n=1 Tax=Halovenus sp. HT40 TaxID=3126691 RepID=UPI00300EE5E5
MTAPEERDEPGDPGDRPPAADGTHRSADETRGERTTKPGETGSAGESDSRNRPTAGGTRDPPRATRANGPDSGEPDELTMFLRDIVTSVGAVLLVGLYIFMISGVWPPMVAIESGSMEPNMSQNDLVFVMETDRFQPEAAHDETGVVTAQQGAEAGYEKFGQDGDVIVYNPQGNEEVTPIIHRAMFWVEEGENWCEKANESYVSDPQLCEEAPHAGFITKGDHNPTYDQSGNGNLDPVKPEWVVGTAEQRVPGLGWLRLQF